MGAAPHGIPGLPPGLPPPFNMLGRPGMVSNMCGTWCTAIWMYIRTYIICRRDLYVWVHYSTISGLNRLVIAFLKSLQIFCVPL